MRTMTVEKLLKGMPILQSQIDALLDFEVSHTQISISIILESFLLSPFCPPYTSFPYNPVPLCLFMCAGATQGSKQRSDKCLFPAAL